MNHSVGGWVVVSNFKASSFSSFVCASNLNLPYSLLSATFNFSHISARLISLHQMTFHHHDDEDEVIESEKGASPESEKYI